ncbi:uncharacterized protein SAPINGB_P005755 [Magnusiomyces paraingens]|uniref:Rho-GAP domain-containing protein n=1 Tax=Magnusiomyces paraingens TaxID=2606893 RepID=A0A5E8C1K3_9ASCO|nr:uncharacterized protein SAPINGB_P005755 [Saprochaete ingens]VVT57557.1 unnamed protein product [Saprochaete ingens]
MDPISPTSTVSSPSLTATSTFQSEHFSATSPNAMPPIPASSSITPSGFSNESPDSPENRQSISGTNSNNNNSNNNTNTNNNNNNINNASGFTPSPSHVQVESSAYLLEEPNLREVMLSDVGVDSLLARLKQSYLTATNIATYLKKRAGYESARIQDLKRLSKSTHDSIRRSDYRQGTFVRQFGEFLNFEDRLVDSSQAFLTAIQSMYEELNELSKAIHKSRKTVKDTALRHERTLVEAEQNAEKAKSKYYGLCEDMEKLKDPTKTKLFKSKNNPQHEQELQTKINAAEQEYRSRVDAVHKLRRELIHTHRPQFIKDLKDYILECDAGITVQLQKLSTLNETLLLQQGFIVCPLKPAGSTTAPLSLKEVVAKIDNDLDFYNDILKIRNSKTLNRPEVNFVQHRYMTAFLKSPAPISSISSTSTNQQSLKNTGTTSQFNALNPPSSQNNNSAIYSKDVTPENNNNNNNNNNNFGQRNSGGQSMLSAGAATAAIGATVGAAVTKTVASDSTTSPNSFSHTYPTSSSMLYPDNSKDSSQSYNDQQTIPIPSPTTLPNHNNNNNNGSTTTSGHTPIPMPSFPSSPTQQETLYPTSTSPSLPPAGTSFSNGSFTTAESTTSPGNYVPTFGSSLDDLIAYENPPVSSPIPRVVLKCVAAISSFGMGIEGIYRIAGDPTQIETLRRMFDEDSSAVDLNNPSQYGINDIHAVSGTLKLYFKQLPDPLLTSLFHKNLIDAATIDSDNARREAIHTIVNQLPDNNYSVLKFIALHLNKVAQHEAQNRMSISTLSNMWGPVLMHSGSPDINDMALMGRAVETILFFCEEIFEYDDEFFEGIGFQI